MLNCRVLFMLAIVIAMLSVTSVYGGPARSLASVMAARTAKIPRTIRAPFRNNEMMTARGFGKRSQMIRFKDDNLLKSEAEIPWSTDKYDAPDGTADNNESTQKLLQSSQFDESYPIEWIVQEMVGNAAFLRSLLEHRVDTNHDGQITLRELFNGVASPYANDLI